MKNNVFRISLSGRFVLAATTIIIVLMIVSVVLIRQLVSVENTITEKSRTQVSQMNNNSEITRKILELTARVRLLEQTYLYNKAFLYKENLLIDEQLQRIKLLSQDSESLVRMDDFIKSFHRFLGNSISLNNILQEYASIDRQLEKSIDRIKFISPLASKENYQNANLISSGIIVENYLNASRLSLSIRGRITPETETILLFDLKDKLQELKVSLIDANFQDEKMINAVGISVKLIDDYSNVLRRLGANLSYRWPIMDALIEDQKKIIDYIDLNEKKMHESVLTTESGMREEILKLRQMILVLSVLIILFSIIIFSILIRRHINKPMQKIVQGINSFEAGKLKEKIELNRSDEWHTIEKSLNSMACRLDETYEQLIEERKNYHYIAYHDPLTGLSNRLFAYEKLEKLINNYHQLGMKFSVIYLDLDEFKQVNDSLGHGVGDKLLKKIANELLAVVGDSADVIRLGGDEFMLLYQNVENIKHVEMHAEELSLSMRKPIALNDSTVVVGSSIGICHFPEHGSDVEALIRNADTAMYQAKRQGSNQVRVYRREMTDKAKDLMHKISGIRHAIENDEFYLVYQPQYDLRTGELVGVEALIRWEHPEWGLICPNEFLPIAEQSDLIGDVDGWVFKRVASQIVEWEKKGLDVSDIKVSLNFSGRKFIESNFIEKLKEILASVGCSASMIEIEITEQDVMTRVEDRSDVMQRLREIGFSLAIDDFGTGYSSFSYLKSLPVDTLKIDKAFVSDIKQNNKDLVIVKTMLSLASMLGLNVVAEGIETEEQKRLLTTNGCRYGQGYFLARPMPLEDIDQLITNRGRPSTAI